MSLARILITGGRIIDPANGIDRVANLLIDTGRIAAITTDTPAADAVIDATGQIVAPGLIDIHVHLREPGHEEEETIASGTAAAVAGGFTSVACMANTHPTIDNESGVEFILRQSGRSARCNVFPVGAITKGLQGKELAEMGSMVRAGAVAFSDDGNGIADAAVAMRAMQYASMFGKVVIEHCEEPSLVGSGSMNSGPTATLLGVPSRPALAETLMVYRDLRLAQATNCRFHASHLSAADAVELVRQAKAQTPNLITAEVTPHHLLLTDECCRDFDTNFKMAPPLRTQKDIEALRAGVADGTIDCLVTDHAPHSREEKELEFVYAPNGIIGLETAVGLFAKALIDTNVIDWPTMIAKLTINPAKVLSVDKGTLTIGADADVTIIHPNLPWTVDVNAFKSKSRNCPWHGYKLNAKPTMTIVAGEIRHRDGL